MNIISLLNLACKKYGDSEGWTNVCAAGTYIKKQIPDFDAKRYGFSKLSKLIENYPNLYEIKKYKGKGTVNIIAYRGKSSQAHDEIKSRFRKYYGLTSILPKPAFSQNGYSYRAVAHWGW